MGDGTKQGGSEGIATLVLWNRMRDRRFEVEVTFGPEGVGPGPPLSGKIACEYSLGVRIWDGWWRRENGERG